MRIRGGLALLIVALIASACNLRRPDVTLTLAPIETDTPEATDVTETPTDAATATVTLSPTGSATSTVTATPSATASLTATSTPTPTATAPHVLTATNTSTATDTQAPTATETPTATDTDLPTSISTATATDTTVPTSTSPPTATHTAEPTATDPPTPTATREPTATSPPTATDTTVPTSTSPPTATYTAEPTTTSPPTATETAQPTLTRILPFTETPSPTTTPIQTEPPSLPQRAEEVLPTQTSQPTAIAQREFEPTLTALPTLDETETAEVLPPPPRPTLDETEVAELLATPPPRPTPLATWTAAPTVRLPDTAPGPATATSPIDRPTPDEIVRFTPGPSDATSPVEVGVRVPPTATATRFQPTVAVRPDLLQPTIAAVSIASTFSTSSASAYQFSVGQGQLFTFQNIQLPYGVMLFKENPIDPNSWISTDLKGILRYRLINDEQHYEMADSPFHHGFSAGISHIDQNKNRILELDWSADGGQFSFRIVPPPGTDTSNAGVWFWQPGRNLATDPTYPIIRDCPADGFKSCEFVQRVGPVWHWETRGVEWSPNPGSNTVLLTVRLPDEGRNALAIAQAVRNPDVAKQQPHFIRYDYGHWNPNGQGIIVSGRRPDGRVIIGEVNNDLSGERLILDASALGLWLRDAVRRPNGQVIALGRPGAPGSGPVALYDSTGRQISGFIGDAPPEDVRWYPERNLVVVSVRGQQFTVQVEGGSIINSTGLTNNPQFSESGLGSSTIPSGVVENSEYLPGQQLRMSQNLNIRGGPSTSNPIVGRLETGDYIAILAGPHRENRYEWWQVQTASNIVGWIAAKIDGNSTVREI